MLGSKKWLKSHFRSFSRSRSPSQDHRGGRTELQVLNSTASSTAPSPSGATPTSTSPLAPCPATQSGTASTCHGSLPSTVNSTNPPFNAPASATATSGGGPKSTAPTQSLSGTLSKAEPRLAVFSIPDVPPDTPLDKAQKDLQASLTDLEAELRKTRSSTQAIPDPGLLLNQSQAQVPPRSLQEVVANLRRAHDEKQNTTLAAAGRFMASLYPASKFIVSLAGTAVSATSVAPAHIATNALGQILDFAMMPSTKTDEILDGLDLLLGDQYFLDQIQRFPVGSIQDEVVVKALELQTVLTDFMLESIKWLRRSYVEKWAGDAFGIQDVHASRDKLEKARKALRIATNDDIYIMLNNRELEKLTQTAIDNMISRDDLVYHLVCQRRLDEDRVTNSGTSIVDNEAYPRWLRGDLRALWCTGLAGAGKTHACAALIADIESRYSRREAGLAFFYCRFDRRGQQNWEALLGTLSAQLAMRNTECVPKLPKIEKHSSVKERERWFLAAAKMFSVVYIVIDGLDEYSADHGEREGLIERILTLCGEQTLPHCRICVVSREANDIYDMLPQASRVEVRATKREITDYVKKEFMDSPEHGHARRLAQRNPGLLQNVTDTVLRKSGCIFRLAALQVAEVMKCATALDIEDRLVKMTGDIDDYYAITMDRISKKVDADRRLIMRLLTWVVYAKRPISVEQLSVALGNWPSSIGEDNIGKAGQWLIPDVEGYVGACEGLLHVRDEPMSPAETDETIKVVTLAHETVDAYFKSRQGNSKMIERPFSTIMLTCIDYLKARGIDRMRWKFNVNDRVIEAYEWIRHGRKSYRNFWTLHLFFNFSQTWGEYADEAVEEDPAIQRQILEFLTSIDDMATECEGWYSIHLCAYQGWRSPLKILLDAGADPNSMLPPIWRERFIPAITPLELAISADRRFQERRSGVAELLIEHEKTVINVSKGQNPKYCTALFACLPWVFEDPLAEKNAALLLKRKDCILTTENWNALFTAAPTLHVELIRVVLAHPNLRLGQLSSDGDTVLTMLVTDFSDVDVFEETALGKYQAVLDLLLDHSASGLPCRRGDREILGLSVPLDPDERNPSGHAAIHLSIIAGNESDPSRSWEYRLRWALRVGSMRVSALQTLASRSEKVNIDLPDGHGHSALDHAIARLTFANLMSETIQEALFQPLGLDAANVDPDFLYVFYAGDVCGYVDDAELERGGPALWWSLAQRLQTVFAKMVEVLTQAGARSLRPYKLELHVNNDENGQGDENARAINARLRSMGR